MGQPVDEHVEAGGESFVAVVEPHVVAEGYQGGEAVGRQRAEELVELSSGVGVLDALLVGGGTGVADFEAEDVADDEEECVAGLPVGELGGV